LIAAGTAGAYSLGMRLSWLFAALTVAGFGSLSLAIYAAASWSLDTKADAELARKTDLVKRLVAEAAGNGDVSAMRHKLDEFFFAHEDLHVVLLDTRGAVRYEGPGRLNPAVLRRRFEFPLPPILATADLSMAQITMDRSDD
jgi:two-component system, OmpR family, heavy metal sensor histidine kinase CusS